MLRRVQSSSSGLESLAGTPSPLATGASPAAAGAPAPTTRAFTVGMLAEATNHDERIKAALIRTLPMTPRPSAASCTLEVLAEVDGRRVLSINLLTPAGSYTINPDLIVQALKLPCR
ncbi:MAG: hypothetical protein SP1CHLAM54_01880 [Chlamydiia bacterium]|nr:hypothetical protein [Chlamydiia bacterium]MCH9615106.1 hypothetical protein [Chlamydiia bacterium]MCH9628572.1 hypothetical protein [Chlamydiia bacterium]